MSSLTKHLEALGYKHETVLEDIVLVRDFLTEESVRLVQEEISRATQKDWESHYMDGVVGLAERKYGRSDIEKLVEEGLVEITHHWVDKNLGLPYEISGPITKKIKEIFSYDSNLVFDGVGTIQRQYSGAELTEHVDNHADPMIEYAVIMYINEDYLDGELFFSRLGLEIKPPAKSLIIFPSGEKYLHGVKPPGDGPLRYVLPSFVRTRAQREGLQDA